MLSTERAPRKGPGGTTASCHPDTLIPESWDSSISHAGPVKVQMGKVETEESLDRFQGRSCSIPTTGVDVILSCISKISF